MHDSDEDDKSLESQLTQDMEVKVNCVAAQLRDDDDYVDNTKDLLIQQIAIAAKMTQTTCRSWN